MEWIHVMTLGGEGGGFGRHREGGLGAEAGDTLRELGPGSPCRLASLLACRPCRIERSPLDDHLALQAFTDFADWFAATHQRVASLKARNLNASPVCHCHRASAKAGWSQKNRQFASFCSPLIYPQMT